jgi:hypothetical protein
MVKRKGIAAQWSAIDGVGPAVAGDNPKVLLQLRMSEGVWGVDPFERREGVQPYSLMMADGGGTWTETGAEKGSPVAGVGEVES